MTLTDYITKHGGTPAKRALADATGLRWQTIHEIAVGRSTPRPDTAMRIEKATGGKVKAADLLGIAKRPMASSRASRTAEGERAARRGTQAVVS